MVRKHLWDGREVSVIGLGSGEFGGKCPEALARELMDAYVSLGGNFLDTARVYGDFVTPRNGESELVIDRWRADRHCRERIFMSTKGGHPPFFSLHESRLSRDEVRGDLADSLTDLQTDRADIFWLHRDDESRPVGEILETLQSLLDDGWTARVGVSNWRTERIREAQQYAKAHGLTPLSGNQPQFSLARTVHFADDTLVCMDDAMYRLHAETGLPCCCFSSQAQVFFSKLEERGLEGLPPSLRQTYESPENLSILERIQALKAETGLSTAAIALAYVTSQPFPCFALAGASRAEQVLALGDAMDAVLTPEQRDRLRRLGQ